MPVCTSCGQENPEIARFCLACGAPLAAPATAGAREERKVVSVLFADLVGFTSRAERLDPEDVRKLLAPYWERVRGELERHGGTVEKFIGDAVVALFGAPVAHEDDPERAVRAALSIRDWIAEQEGDLQLRIAVTTGEALVRLDARPLEGEGVASGDVVNTAARLQAAAPPNGILVDETTFRATAEMIEYRASAPVEAKGKSQPVLVWEAVEARAHFGVDVPRAYTTRLVGRERELDELRDALARARHERMPQLVTLVGVPGIGKSRLVHELFRIVGADPELVRWRQGRSLPYGEGASFWALAEMVKAEARIRDGDDEASSEEKLRRTVADAIEEEDERGPTAERLRPLVGLPGDGAADGDRRSEYFAAWRRYLEGLAERRPTVLVFEDLHWADDDLLDFVDHLADWATGVPLLVVGTARPELLDRRPGWGGGKRNVATLSLSPLRDDETARLLGELLSSSAVPAGEQDDLVARAGGNPLYAEQYARMLAERGADVSARVPETVQGIIAARLDGLAVKEKALLQDAAVIGKVFWLGAVTAIGGTEPAGAEELLHLLERKDFVQRSRRSSVAGDVEYAFRHLLVRDVAYNQIPRAARAEKHRLAAEWIAGLGRPEAHAEPLAHHHLAAFELARAAGADTTGLAAAARAALTDAGDRAFSLNALAAAVRCYAGALELTPPDDEEAYALALFRHARSDHARGSRDPAPLGRALDALFAVGEFERAAEIATRRANATWMIGQRDLAMQQLEQATTLAERLPPSETKAFVLGYQCRFLMVAGRGEESVAVGEAALAMIDDLGLEQLRPPILTAVGAARVSVGQVERGIAELKQAIELAERRNDSEAIRGNINLASCLSSLGDAAGSRDYHERGLELARAQFGSSAGTVFLTAELAVDKYHAGEWDEAAADAGAVIAAVAASPHFIELIARWVRGWIVASRGAVEAGLRDLDRSLELGRSSKDPQSLYVALGTAAELHVDIGRTDEAAALADELLEHVRRGEERGPLEEWAAALALTLHALGRAGELRDVVATAQLETRWADALRHVAAGELAAAADALHDVGDLPHEAKARLLSAEELAASGRGREAAEELERALAFYRSVGATFFVARAEAVLSATA